MKKVHKIGEEIKRISVEINKDMTFKVTQNVYKIIGVNNDYICYADHHFSHVFVGKGKSYISNRMNDVSIVENTSSTMIKYFGLFQCYITSQMSDKAIENKLSREFNKWINEKIGKYGAAKNVEIKLNEVAA